MNTTLKHISPSKAVELLKKNGIVVSEGQAKQLTDFLYTIGDIAIDQYIRDEMEKKKSIPLKS